METNTTELKELKKNIDLSILLLRQSTEEKKSVSSLISRIEANVSTLFKECMNAKKEFYKIKRMIRE